MIRERQNLKDFAQIPLTEERLQELYGKGEQLKKFILQETSPYKYNSAGRGIVNDLTANQNTIAH